MTVDDPGWPSARLLMPFGLGGSYRGMNTLLVLRAVFVRFAGALVGFAIALAVLAGRDRSSVDVVVVAVAIVVGAGSLTLQRVHDRALPCSNDKLVLTYRTRFFFRLATAEAPALVGFVGFFLVGNELWAYALGCVFAATGFAYAAPTRGQVIRDQQALERGGCERSLLESLAGD